MDTNLIYSLITSFFVGGTAGYLGSLMISKKMALTGDALGHVALPGMGIALLFGLNVSLGAFVFLFLGVLLVWFLEGKTQLPIEALVGVIFVLSLAVGFLITPDPELLHVLIGDVGGISLNDTIAAVVLSISALFLIQRIYSKLMLALVSKDLASASGINVRKYDLFYLLLISVIVALGVRVVGSLLVGALIIVPAATARNLSRNMRQYSLVAITLGTLSCLTGVYLSRIVNLPAGPLVILSSVSLFTLSLLLKRN